MSNPHMYAQVPIAQHGASGAKRVFEIVPSIGFAGRQAALRLLRATSETARRYYRPRCVHHAAATVSEHYRIGVNAEVILRIF